ncbi:MAG: hypothetical protein H0W71_09610 [Sphingomonas sp.]|nr:hypothetical protein [Sphingomonas sp.]
MRKLILIAAAAGTALAFAAPATAQYFPQPQQPAYGYNSGYNSSYNGYGNNGYGQLRSMQSRIDGIQRQIEQLKARRMISRNEANGLRAESRNLENRLARASRYGLNPNEARTISYGIARLEQHVAREARDGRGRGYGYGYGNGQYGNGYNNGYGGYGQNNAYYTDSDRDGHDDNDEHEQWHDEHDD